MLSTDQVSPERWGAPLGGFADPAAGLGHFGGSLYEASLTCLKCGKSIQMDSLFCRYCGHKKDQPVGADAFALTNGFTPGAPDRRPEAAMTAHFPTLDALGRSEPRGGGLDKPPYMPPIEVSHPAGSAMAARPGPGAAGLVAGSLPMTTVVGLGVVLPMIVCGMIQSMAMMRELPGARNVAIWVLGLYAFTTVAAAVEGVLISTTMLENAITPLDASSLHPVQDPPKTPMSQVDTVLNIFDQLVPQNIVGDAAQNRLLSVIMMSILVGLLIPTSKVDGGRSSTLEVVDEINEVVSKVIKFLILLSPAGVCSLVFAGAVRFDLSAMGAAVVALVGAVLTALGLHMFIFCPTLLALGARQNPAKYFRNCIPVLLTALGASSSAASLPMNIEVAIEKNGLKPHVAKFTLNLGATINMDGTGIYLICATVCIATLQGVVLGPGDLAVLCVMATLCSMGAAPVPSASLVLLATLLSTLNIPVTETFGLITAIDWLLDRFRTTCNVYGDACVAAVVNYRTDAPEEPKAPDFTSLSA